MEDILHQLIGSLSHYLQGFIHPRWCRISSINSTWILREFTLSEKLGKAPIYWLIEKPDSQIFTTYPYTARHHMPPCVHVLLVSKNHPIFTAMLASRQN